MDDAWRLWGPYLSERAWGTVREDYSADGDAWRYVTHDRARSYAYRWSEDGLAGICDLEQRLCLAFAFWNGHDPILKERIFGLTGHEGNHGEDAKELWWYLDGTPSAATATLSFCSATTSRTRAASGTPTVRLSRKTGSATTSCTERRA